MKNFEKVGIVIPVYNEAKSLPLLLEELKNLDYLNNEFKFFEILVVDDGSTDETSQILKKIDYVSIFTHGYNMGVGAAVRSGLRYFENKKFDYVVKIDGDRQHKVEEIKLLIEPLRENKADLVYGDRFNGNIKYNMPRYRILGNKLFTFLLNKLTKYKISDSQPGFFAGNNYFLKNFYILTNYNYTQQVLYSSYLAGLRFLQIPITFEERTQGDSFVKLNYPFKAILQILLMIMIKKPLTIFGNIGLIMTSASVIIFVTQLMQYFTNNSSRPIENVNLVLGLSVSGIVFLISSIVLKSIQNLEEINRRNIN